MKATLFKEVSYSLSKLIEDIDVGEIGLPDIQRPFVWTKAKVRDLFDSMYNGFPVGYLLFWGNVGASGTRQIGTNGKQAVPRLLIVDGQQRLTSLYAVLKGLPVVDENYRVVRIKIAFRPRDEQFAVPDAAIERDPEFISDISQLWVGPVSRNRFVKQFLDRLSSSRPLTEDDEDHLTEAIDRLYDLQSYPFTALELSSTIDEEKVAEVFVRINSKGVALNQADFILTLMSVWWDDGRKDLESFSRATRQPSASGPSPYNHFIQATRIRCCASRLASGSAAASFAPSTHCCAAATWTPAKRRSSSATLSSTSSRRRRRTRWISATGTSSSRFSSAPGSAAQG